MKLDTDKERAMTPEFIEQQRPLFEAAFAEKYMKGCAFNFGGLDVDRNYFADWVQDRFDGWILARSAELSQEPVAYCVPDATGKPLFSKGWMFSPIPHLSATMPLYTAPPAPVSADVAHGSAEEYLRGKYGAYCGHFAWRELEEAFNAGRASPVSAEPVRDDANMADLILALQDWKATSGKAGAAAYDKLLGVMASMLKANETVTPAPAAPLSDAKDAIDAKRYRWIRSQHWNDSNLFVVSGSKSVVRLGTDCPSNERLDSEIDTAIAASKEAI